MQTHLCTTYRHWRNASHCVLIKVNPNVYLLWSTPPLGSLCTSCCRCCHKPTCKYVLSHLCIYKGAQKYEWVHWVAWKVTLTIFNWKIFIIYQFVCTTNNNNHNQKNKIKKRHTHTHTPANINKRNMRAFLANTAHTYTYIQMYVHMYLSILKQTGFCRKMLEMGKCGNK